MKRSIAKKQINTFQKKVYRYYHEHKRALPWRKTRDPYKILVSEMMLQQTYVMRVLSKYGPFVRAVPTLQSLDQAPLRKVLSLWQGLGYNRRALALKKLAEHIVKRHHARVPHDVSELQQMPGVGGAAAGAVCAFAFDQPTAFIETNIRSVFIHEFFHDKDGVGDADILPLVEKTVDRQNPREWYYALMDYGVYLKEKHPNPSRRSAHYAGQSRFEGSRRQVRGAVIKALVKRPQSEKDLSKRTGQPVNRIGLAIRQLESEGLVRRSGKDIKV